MNRLKLLYAEDEQETRKDHIAYLKSRYEFTFYEANDGVEALELYKKYNPDIILTDITMPNMNGLELAKEIRKISLHTQIIILTAHSEQEVLIQAFNSNVVNYLIKPINRHKLRSSIDIATEILVKPRYTEKYIFLGEDAKFDISHNQYYIDNKAIKLSKSENKLLELLCRHPNQELNAYDLFIHVWDDFDKEFSTDSVRTLVKKLRKKLPDDILQNIYGGFYKLCIK